MEGLPSVIKALGSSLSTTQQNQLKMDGSMTYNYQPHKTRGGLGSNFPNTGPGDFMNTTPQTQVTKMKTDVATSN